MTGLGHDVRLALRQLRRQPLFALAAVLTLALGLGINAVAFTVVNAMVFRRPALAIQGTAGRIETTPAVDEDNGASAAEYRRFGDATRGALDLAAEGRLTLAWRHDGITTTAWTLMVTRNYFSLLDARTIAGRADLSHNPGNTPAVVVGERFWRQQLSAAPLAGLTLHLNGTEANAVGILPESFKDPGGLYSPDVWIALDDAILFRTGAEWQKRDDRGLLLFGRVRPGVGVPEVQSRIAAAAAAMAHDWPDTHSGRGARFRLLNDATSERRGVNTAAALTMGVIGLVLLLACFNVANLLLARAVERERDMAVRAALGAGRARLVRLVAIDGMILGALAGTAALLLAWWTQALVGSFAMPIEEPQHIDLSMDGRVVGFILGLAGIAGVAPGLWAALSATRADIMRVLGSHGTRDRARATGARQWLIGLQVAGSTAFLCIASLFVQSQTRLANAEMGFARDHLLVAEFDPASHGYDRERARRYVDELLARARALPGARDAAVADRAPFFIGFDRLTALSATGPCDAGACAKYPTYAIGPGYFRTLGVPVAAGREFEPAGAGREAIVNQPLARLLWPDGRAIGRTLRLAGRSLPVTVVGVTAAARSRSLDREQPALYLPIDGEDFERGLTLVVRTAGPPAALVRAFDDAAQTLDPNVAMLSVKPMTDRMAVQLWPVRTLSRLFSICGLLALVLATAGVAGVVIYSVMRRFREFGVRLSLGATPSVLILDVLGGGLRLLLPGLLGGALLAAGVSRLVQAVFLGVNVLNPLTYAGVAFLETLVVVAACLWPALRAARVDPLVALRAE
jgi:predicted permease